MSEAKLQELKNDIAELKTLLEKSVRKRVQDLISVEVRKLETEVTKLQEQLKLSSTPVATAAGPSPVSSAEQRRYEIKLNGYGWDQSDKYVKIFVTLKNVQNLPKEQVTCKLTEKSMELRVQNLENKDYVLVINKLLEPISVEDSHWKQKTDMVVVFLAKARPNNKWACMTELEKRSEDAKASKFKTDNAPKDPQESIMSLMKNMYETGDDDMKRMIAKAWTEGQDKKKSSTLDL